MKTSREIRTAQNELIVARSQFKSQLTAFIVDMSKSELIEFHHSFIYVLQTITSESYIDDPDLAARELVEIAQNAKTLQRYYLSRAALIFAAFVEKRDAIVNKIEAR